MVKQICDIGIEIILKETAALAALLAVKEAANRKLDRVVIGNFVTTAIQHPPIQDITTLHKSFKSWNAK